MQTTLAPPTTIRKSVDEMLWKLEENRKRKRLFEQQLAELQAYLSISDQVTEALDMLSQKLFEQVLGLLERNLTTAIQEVLEQPIQFKTEASFKHGAANVEFSIDREGNSEDVNRGQGGSVQNVLSVGLRMFALATLDENHHRRFLLLDEQDCWLRPELVPRLVKIVHQAASKLGFQVIMISHHDLNLFDQYADKVYRLTPTQDGVEVGLVGE